MPPSGPRNEESHGSKEGEWYLGVLMGGRNDHALILRSGRIGLRVVIGVLKIFQKIGQIEPRRTNNPTTPAPSKKICPVECLLVLKANLSRALSCEA